MKNWKSWWAVALVAFAISWLGDLAFMSWMSDGSWTDANKWAASWNLESRNWWGLETILAYAWFALALTFVFIKGYEGKNWLEGVRFGTYMWALSVGVMWVANMWPTADWWMWAALFWVGYAFTGTAMWWSYKPSMKNA